MALTWTQVMLTALWRDGEERKTENEKECRERESERKVERNDHESHCTVYNIILSAQIFHITLP